MGKAASVAGEASLTAVSLAPAPRSAVTSSSSPVRGRRISLQRPDCMPVVPAKRHSFLGPPSWGLLPGAGAVAGPQVHRGSTKSDASPSVSPSLVQRDWLCRRGTEGA